MKDQGTTNQANTSRRNFLKTSTAAVAGASLASRLGDLPAVHAAGSDEIRVGVIGCGGRGTGAAQDVITAAPGVKIIALADAFEDHLDKCLEQLKKTQAANIDIPENRQFVGFNAAQQLLDLKEVNYVILATPPGFRPPHLTAAVAAGKNIFTEKPLAVDGTGIRAVLAAYEAAKVKGLKIVCGLQRHHQTGYLETMKQIKNGAIGQILAARAYWNQGDL